MSTLTVAPPSRRDFLYISTAAMATVGVAAWPLIDQMNPDAAIQAFASIDVDLSAIAVGQIVTVKWHGGPVFIRRRTTEEIASVADTPHSELIDPQSDAQRVQRPEWLIVSGICTHLGCVPTGQEGDHQGWLCHCHGSVYDVSGRVVHGPAPRNLPVPEYSFLSDTKVKIG